MNSNTVAVLDGGPPVEWATDGVLRNLTVFDSTDAAIRSLTSDERSHAVAFPSDEHPLHFITRLLDQRRVETLHLVAHGSDGSIRIGGHHIDHEDLLDWQASVRTWRVSRIALWCCGLGNNEGFVDLLARLTSAEVFASRDAIGTASDGTSHWALQSRQAAPCALVSPPFSVKARAAFVGTLGSVSTTFAKFYSGTVASSKFSQLAEVGTNVTFTQTTGTHTGASDATTGFDSSGNDVYGQVTAGGTTYQGRITGTTNDNKAYIFTATDGTEFILLKNGEATYPLASSSLIQFNSSFNSTQLSALNSYQAAQAGSNTAPTITTPGSVALVDTSATDTFSATTGTISAADSDGIASYGITGGTSGGTYTSSASGSSVTYNVSKTGTYGVLYLESSTGKYIFVPNSNASLNALAASGTETFTVTATDSNNASPATGSATLTVNFTGANDTPVNTSSPSLSGAAAVGNALTGSNGSWTDAEGQTLSYTYQWQVANDAAGTGAANIASATNSSFTVTSAQAHKFIRLIVTAADTASGSQTAQTSWSAVANTTPTNTSAPTIGGTASVGRTVTATAGGWSDADGDSLSYSYQWYRADDNSGTNETVIAGATNSSYATTASDAVKYLRVVVTVSDSYGAVASATSARSMVRVPVETDLAPQSTAGLSGTDRVTGEIKPGFEIKVGALLQPSQTARLIDPAGKVIGSTKVSAAEAGTGKVTVPTTTQLDDGRYTYTAQLLDSSGTVIGESPINVMVVTDRDGIMPSVELAANGGDFNKDGQPDWRQPNVAQLPLTSVEDFIAGKDAPPSSFGAIIAGKPDPSAPMGFKLDDSAQLVDLKVSSMPAGAPLPLNITPRTPIFEFGIQPLEGSKLVDSAPSREGLQVQTVIVLPQGVKANAFMKYDPASKTWFNYATPEALSGAADGAALIDSDGDGLIDRIVITVTDGGIGDEDGKVDGKIVDPGLLADDGSEPTLSSATDADGVSPYVEAAANGGDFNKDGVPDWDQAAVAQLPLGSYGDYLLGRYAPQSSFGAIMVGSADRAAPVGARINATAQLSAVELGDPSIQRLPAGFQAASALFSFTVMPAKGTAGIVDMNASREGRQVQVMIDITSGIKATAFLIFDPVSRTWFDYTDPSAADGSADGATLLDTNNDGAVDRIMITLTDAGIGDQDGMANGLVRFSGMLVNRSGMSGPMGVGLQPVMGTDGKVGLVGIPSAHALDSGHGFNS
jgi:hypothetical protein